MNGEFSHLDSVGKARMVDVSDKPVTCRMAVAVGRVMMKPETARMIQSGSVPKGDVLSVSRLAGIMGAKRTSELIPLCHPLPLTSIAVELEVDAEAGAVEITASVKTEAKTGAEMEALTAVSVAALALYDMCKSADKTMRIEGIQLEYKSGGRSGTFGRDPAGGGRANSR